MKNNEKLVVENDTCLVEVLPMGATCTTFLEKASGINCILNYPTAEDYQRYATTYLGAVIGRCANRIRQGKMKLANQSYQLSMNEAAHSLHGGHQGWSTLMFHGIKQDNRLIFTAFDLHLSNGYPGNLMIRVIYELIDNRLLVHFRAVSDQDTLFNPTHHLYFNLMGSSSLLDHELCIPTEQVAVLDGDGCCNEATFDGRKTAFDFSSMTSIVSQLQRSHPNLVSSNGFDHTYVFERLEMKRMATLQSPLLRLTINSDLPNLHLYTANFLNNAYYKPHAGVCLECHFYPNAINYSHRLQPLLKAFQIQDYLIEYQVERRTYELTNHD